MRVVLLSGGVDSTVALADEVTAGHDCLAVTFDYGQTPREIDAAELIAAHYRVPHRVVELPVLAGSALTGDAPMPERPGGAAVVPARNVVFLSVGASIAASVDAAVVVFGANFDDRAEYVDCRPQFVAGMNELLTVSMPRPVWVHAPYLRFTKEQIRERGRALAAPLELAWSCYRDGDAPCGACGGCSG